VSTLIKKTVIILVILLLSSTKVSAALYSNIEIFDINKGCVIKSMLSNQVIQKEVVSYIKGITSIYGKFKPIPKNGFMIKIYLNPSILVENKIINGVIDEVIIIFPQKEKPFLMVFDDTSKPFFYRFDIKTDNLLKMLNFDSNSIEYNLVFDQLVKA
jgi:hypothetical protein